MLFSKGPPQLHATATSPTSVLLEWSIEAIDTGRTPLKGFLLSYRRELGDWEELSLNRRINSYTLDDLQCGTMYQFTLAAFNKIGTGGASKIESARTKGKKPISPEGYHFIRTNITSVSLDLSTWQDGGCPIQAFTVEFRRRDSTNGNDYIVVSSNVPAKTRYLIPDLEPSTAYNLRITANNNAGATIAAYTFKTLTINGDSDRNDLISSHENNNNNAYDSNGMDSMPLGFSFDSNILVLLAGSILGIASALFCACFCFRTSEYRRFSTMKIQIFLGFQSFPCNSSAETNYDAGSGSETRGLSESSHQNSSMQSEYKLGPGEHRDKFYATARKPMPEQQSPSGNTLERIPEYSEDIYPYATYLPNEDNLAGNPMMSRYGTTNNAGTIPISAANLYNSRHPISSSKDVSSIDYRFYFFAVHVVFIEMCRILLFCSLFAHRNATSFRCRPTRVPVQ